MGTIPDGIDDPYDGPWGGIATELDGCCGIHDGPGAPRLEVRCIPDGGAMCGKAFCNGAIEGNYR